MRASRRTFLFGLASLALVGCRCGDSAVRDLPPIDVALSAPWTDWDLPLGEGRVVFSNARMITVHYPSGTPEALARTWRAHLLGRGWSQRSDVSGADMVSFAFEQGDRTLALGAYPGTDDLVLTLTLFTPGPDPAAGAP